MDAELDEGIYRAMVEENGLPKLGLKAVTLGVRVGIDILPDSANLVHLPAFLPGDENGISCAPTINTLPIFALPVEWGGTNKKTVVWKIEEADLGTALVAVEDTTPGGRRHLSIGPSGTMPCDDYARAVEATRTKWKKVTKGG